MFKNRIKDIILVKHIVKDY